MKAVLILLIGLWAVCEASKKEGFQEDFEFVEDGKERTGTAVSGERKTWLLDSNNALCGLLRCGRREVCLLQDRFTAVCVNKAEVTRNGDKIVPLKDVADASDEDLPKSWDALDDYEDDDDDDDEDYDDDEDDEYLLNDEDDDDNDDYDSQRETTPGTGDKQRLNRRPFAEKRCPTCPVVRPVFLCGSDNRTYSSLCRLHYHNCIHDASVRIACKGFCPCKDPNSHASKKERQRERMGAYLNKLQATKDASASTPDPSSASTSSSSSSSSAAAPASSGKGGDHDNITHGHMRDDQATGRSRDNNNNSAGNSRREKHSREGGNKYNNRVRSRFAKVKPNKGNKNNGRDKSNYNKYNSKYGKDAFRKSDSYNVQQRQWPWPSEESTHKATNTVWGPNECTQEALEAMGNRMLDWFSVIMADSRSRANAVTTVSVSAPSWCKPEVSWMLGHLDGDHDGRLSVKELYQLEHDDHERCIKPFIDRCDLDRDIFLSSREWCKCFDKSERPCAALRKQSKGLLGGYIPECDSEGYYQATQCHAGAGVCWCVDRHGVELPNTRTRNTPNCDAIVNSEEVSNRVDDDAEDGDDFLDTVEGSADMPLDI